MNASVSNEAKKLQANLMEYLESSSSQRSKTSNESKRGAALLASVPLLHYAESSCSTFLRTRLVKAIISDVSGDDCKWSQSDVLTGLRVLKELSRLPGSSETLGEKDSLLKLVAMSKKHYMAINVRIKGSPSSVKQSEKNASPHALDLLLRTLNNVLLQSTQARQLFGSVECGGIQLALDLIEGSSSTSIDVVFLSARLIFFTTLYEAEVTKEAVEQMKLVQIFSQKVAELTASNSNECDSALAELQKAFFNIGLYYPRLASSDRSGDAVVGESFNEALLPFLSPTIHMVTSHTKSSSTHLSPPITNAIAVLLNFPVSPYQSTWSKAHSTPLHIREKMISNESDDSSSSIRSSPTSKAIRSATKFFTRKNSSSPPSSSLMPPSTSKSSQGTFLETLLDFLDEFLTYYFTTLDMDDQSSLEKAKAEGVDVQDYAEPALLLCRRMTSEVEEYRLIVKSRILPDDIDRSFGLDTRMDFTGILIRLMSCSLYTRLARASGELLLAVCQGQAAKMTAEIGYGPCAGFLMQIGQLSSLPGSSISTSSGKLIDPVTGKEQQSQEEMLKEDQLADLVMSDEEKEVEADRLLSLFDRMDRNGIIKMQNPMVQALESGKIKELEEKQEEEERKRVAKEDEEFESTVEKEMKVYREKNTLKK